MTPLAHPIPAEWLTAYYDDELDAVRKAQVEAHLPKCAECRRELGGLKVLSQALASDELPQDALTRAEAVWRSVQTQLPDRQTARLAGSAAAPVNARGVLLRWFPGIILLLLSGAIQVAAVAGTAFLAMTSQLWGTPAWATWLYQLAAGSTLSWLAWLLPINWSGLELFLLWMLISANLALLYLAWLGYELRYGASATIVRVTAWRGD